MPDADLFENVFLAFLAGTSAVICSVVCIVVLCCSFKQTATNPDIAQTSTKEVPGMGEEIAWVKIELKKESSRIDEPAKQANETVPVV